jgi:hypothetical protein
MVATLGIQPGAPPADPRLDWVLVANRADRNAAGDQSRPLGHKVGRNEVKVVRRLHESAATSCTEHATRAG